MNDKNKERKVKLKIKTSKTKKVLYRSTHSFHLLRRSLNSSKKKLLMKKHTEQSRYLTGLNVTKDKRLF